MEANNIIAGIVTLWCGCLAAMFVVTMLDRQRMRREERDRNQPKE